jgi:hypothetical protein
VPETCRTTEPCQFRKGHHRYTLLAHASGGVPEAHKLLQSSLSLSAELSKPIFAGQGLIARSQAGIQSIIISTGTRACLCGLSSLLSSRNSLLSSLSSAFRLQASARLIFRIWHLPYMRRPRRICFALRNESRPAWLSFSTDNGGNHGSRNFALALGSADSDHHPARAYLALGGCDRVHIYL